MPETDGSCEVSGIEIVRPSTLVQELEDYGVYSLVIRDLVRKRIKSDLPVRSAVTVPADNYDVPAFHYLEVAWVPDPEMPGYWKADHVKPLHAAG